MADNFHHFGIVESNKAYTTKALAAILGWKDDEFLRAWFDRGLRSSKIGKTRMVLGSDVIRFLDENGGTGDGD